MENDEFVFCIVILRDKEFGVLCKAASEGDVSEVERILNSTNITSSKSYYITFV